VLGLIIGLGTGRAEKWSFYVDIERDARTLCILQLIIYFINDRRTDHLLKKPLSEIIAVDSDNNVKTVCQYILQSFVNV
jgi:hypothetical protein